MDLDSERNLYPDLKKNPLEFTNFAFLLAFPILLG
jgi:hypothetical protein